MRLLCLIIATLLVFPFASCTRQAQQVTENPTASEERSAYYKWSSMEVIDALMAGGLEVEGIKPGFIVGVHRLSENTIFLMPSLGKDVGGVVSCFNTEEAQNEFEKFYMKMNEDAGQPVWRISRKDNVVLMISGKVPRWISRQYEQALMDMEK